MRDLKIILKEKKMELTSPQTKISK